MFKYKNIEIFEKVPLTWEEEIIKEQLKCFSSYLEEDTECKKCPIAICCKSSLLEKIYQTALDENIAITDNIEDGIVKGNFFIPKGKSAFHNYDVEFVCGFCNENIKDNSVWLPNYGLVHEFCYKSENLKKRSSGL